MLARPSPSRSQHSRTMSAKYSHIPPSTYYGSLNQPTISVRMPAWEVNPIQRYVHQYHVGSIPVSDLVFPQPFADPSRLTARSISTYRPSRVTASDTPLVYLSSTSAGRESTGTKMALRATVVHAPPSRWQTASWWTANAS